jgi:triacylglycerol esterase/lipase EstA (alpha/beta hydrolase family)
MVVAHSMGGLVVRAYMRTYGAGKLARVLTIGSPHHGSMHAWLFVGTSLAQMRPGNAWLAALNREPIDPALRFVSLWSWHDSMVAPQTSSELPGAVDVTLVGVGHNALLGEVAVFECTQAEIAAAHREARHSG